MQFVITPPTAVHRPAPSVGGFGGQGGAVVNRGKLTVSGTSFSGDVAGGGGVSSTTNGFGAAGGAINTDGVLVVTGSSFDDETAQAGATASGHTGGTGGSGGVIFANGGKVTITSTTFGTTHVNTAVGGAIANGSGLRFATGGAIQAENTDLRLSADRFAANEAGGGIGTSPSTFGQGGEGGALWLEGGRIAITSTTFGSGNVADGAVEPPTGTLPGGLGGEGGAIFVEDAAVSIERSTFQGTVAAGGTPGTTRAGVYGTGGAIYDKDGGVTIDRSSFAGDQAQHGQDTATSGGDGGRGGAIEGDGGSLQISATKFTNNKSTASSLTGSAGEGGAIDSSGTTITVSSSSFTGNAVPAEGPAPGSGGEGGAVYAQDPAPTFTNDLFKGNSAPGPGGRGGALELNSATIVASTITGNSSEEGGAIQAGGSLAVVNSTIAGNTATDSGGGIQANSVSLENVTLARNRGGPSGGGNLYLQGAESLHDTLIVGGTLTGATGTENCFIQGQVVESHNLEDRNQCGFHGTGDQVNVAAPHVGTLKDNGGPLPTMALLPGSAAINGGDPGGCTDADANPLTTDERGVPRPQGPRCDIGAFEFARPTIRITSPVAGPSYGVGQRVLAHFVCSEAATPGLIRTCLGTVAAGHALNTANAGRHVFKVTARDKAGVTSSLTVHYLVVASITGLKISPSRVVAQASGASIAAAHGATVSYHDTTAAKTTFVVESLRGSHPARVGSFSHHDRKGADQFHFTGRVGGQKLKTGKYLLVATPSAGGVSGHAVSVAFQVVSR